MRQIKLSIDDVSSCLCTFYNNGKANVMLIDDVKTEEKFKNKGYATRLFKEVIAEAKKSNVDSIELIVNRDNKIAKNLYKKVGFLKTKKECYRLILKKFV